MAPGPMTTSARGGFGFGHQYRGGNFGRVFSVPSTGRAYGAQPAAPQQQRFHLDGSGHGVLEAGDQVTVTIDDEGNTVISVTDPENGGPVEEAEDGDNGNGPNGTNDNDNGEEESARRSFFGRAKMLVNSNPDGSVLIRPERDNTLQVLGDSDSGAVTVVEIEPDELNVADNRL